MPKPATPSVPPFPGLGQSEWRPWPLPCTPSGGGPTRRHRAHREAAARVPPLGGATSSDILRTLRAGACHVFSTAHTRISKRPKPRSDNEGNPNHHRGPLLFLDGRGLIPAPGSPRPRPTRRKVSSAQSASVRTFAWAACPTTSRAPRRLCQDCGVRTSSSGSHPQDARIRRRPTPPLAPASRNSSAQLELENQT